MQSLEDWLRVEFDSAMTSENNKCSREELERLHNRMDDFETEVRLLRWLLAGSMALLFALLMNGMLK